MWCPCHCLGGPLLLTSWPRDAKGWVGEAQWQSTTSTTSCLLLLQQVLGGSMPLGRHWALPASREHPCRLLNQPAAGCDKRTEARIRKRAVLESVGIQTLLNCTVTRVAYAPHLFTQPLLNRALIARGSTLLGGGVVLCVCSTIQSGDCVGDIAALCCTGPWNSRLIPAQFG